VAELEVGLRADPFDLTAQVERHNGPALLTQLFDERVPPAEPAFLILQPRAAARLQVSVLLAGKEERELGLGPIDEDRAVRGDGIDVLLAFWRVAGGRIGDCLVGCCGCGAGAIGLAADRPLGGELRWDRALPPRRVARGGANGRRGIAGRTLIAVTWRSRIFFRRNVNPLGAASSYEGEANR
jgi:hypothetical protein